MCFWSTGIISEAHRIIFFLLTPCIRLFPVRITELQLVLCTEVLSDQLQYKFLSGLIHFIGIVSHGDFRASVNQG